MRPEHMAELADLIHDGLSGPTDAIVLRTTAFRSRFHDLHDVRA